MASDHAEIEAVFNAAVALPVADREDFLQKMVSGNPRLIQRVRQLLASHDAAGSFLDMSELDEAMPTAGVQVQEGAGSIIGRYKLLQMIGEGGFGVVFVAEQLEPVRRQVALKIIKLGMDTRQVVARFEAERQALAMMDHPNIAKVLDAGTTTTGRPFFVMELVHGKQITSYCNEHNLSIRDRLSLFVEVCSAVQHAHQKGIIHRDIKPSNVLVSMHDGKPVPKVIDFGIAKATQGRLTDRTLITEFRQMMGTPAYMSPEQVLGNGLDVDTRSDIYSMGVLLYELLTGSTPFSPHEFMRAAFDEVQRIIREVEPQKPSTRILARSQQSKTDSGIQSSSQTKREFHSIQGDLDCIVMKCLEKDRTRRYETANGLAQDIQRHLKSEPVLARPASSVYRFRRMVRRNKLTFAATAAVAAALVLGVLGSTWEAVRAIHAEREQSRLRAQAEFSEKNARAEAARSQQVARFMKEMLSGVESQVALGRDTQLLRQIVNQTADRLATELKDQPEVEADLRQTLGQVYLDLSDYVPAEVMYAESLRLRRQLAGTDNLQVAEAMDLEARALDLAGKNGDGLAMARNAIALKRKLLGNDHPAVAESLHNLGRAMRRSSQGAAPAEEPLEEALAIRRKSFGNENLAVADTLTELGLSIRAKPGRASEATPLLREALEIRQKLLGRNHPVLGESISALALSIADSGKTDEAIATMRQAIEMNTKFYGQTHRATLTMRQYLGRWLVDEGKLAEAETELRNVLDLYKTRPNWQSIDTGFVGFTILELARALSGQDKLQELREQLATLSAEFALKIRPEEPAFSAAVNHIAVALNQIKQIASYQTVFSGLITDLHSRIGANNPFLLQLRLNYVRKLNSVGMTAEARSELNAVVEELRTTGDWEDANFSRGVAETVIGICVQLRNQQRTQDAEVLLVGVVAELQRRLPPNDPILLRLRTEHGQIYLSQNKLAEAESELLTVDESWQSNTTRLTSDFGPSISNLMQLADLLMGERKFEEALRLLTARYPTIAAARTANDLQMVGFRVRIGRALRNLGRFPEAEAELRGAFTDCRSNPNWRKQTEAIWAFDELISLYRQQARPEAIHELVDLFSTGAASQIDPILTRTRLALIQTLSDSGATDRAETELQAMFAALKTGNYWERPADLNYLADTMATWSYIRPAGEKSAEVRSLIASFFTEVRAGTQNQIAAQRVATAVNEVIWRNYIKGRSEAMFPIAEADFKFARERLDPKQAAFLNLSDTAGWIFLTTGHTSEAVDAFEQLVGTIKKSSEPSDAFAMMEMESLAVAYRRAGRAEESRALLEQVIQQRQAKRLATFGDNLFVGSELTCHYNLGLTLLAEGKWDLAIQELKPAIDQVRPHDLLGAMIRNAYAEGLSHQGLFDQAEPILLDSYRDLKNQQAGIPGNPYRELSDAAKRIVSLYTNWNKPAEVTKWKGELTAIPRAPSSSTRPTSAP